MLRENYFVIGNNISALNAELLHKQLPFKIHYVTHCLTAYLYPGIIGGNVDLPPSHPGGDVVALPCSYSDYTDS